MYEIDDRDPPWFNNKIKSLIYKKKHHLKSFAAIEIIVYKKTTKYSSRSFKGTHREKATSNVTSGLTESTNMDIWVVGTSN